jgi:hypothetical protein
LEKEDINFAKILHVKHKYLLIATNALIASFKPKRTFKKS